MMTIEQKAKAYDEALKWMREVYPTLTGAAKEDAEHYFPELRESEDERIRKEMIRFLKKIENSILENYTTVPLSEFISYLEKQKEQKPAEPISKETCLNEMLKNGQISLSDYLSLTKEQKSVKKQDYSCLNDLERAIHRGFLCAGVENVPVTIIKETAQDCLAQQEAEWNREDKACRDTILCAVQGKFVTDADLEQAISWLKSLRPSWKPSEEQMSALLWCIAHLGGADRRVLAELYEHLKMYCQ